MGGSAFRRPGAHLHVSLQNLPRRGSVALGMGIVQTNRSVKPVELQGL